MEPFSLRDPVPEQGTTIVLEASAGTGKTFALAGLVTRYLADGAATLDEMLLITFGKAASRELRERVRGQLVSAVASLDGGQPPSSDIEAYLVDGDDQIRAQRRARLRDALAGFDSATIVTTHQFCSLVLKSLGVAGDTDAGATLVESLDDLIAEIVDDLYLQRFGQQESSPLLSPTDALVLAKAAVGDPCSKLRPSNPDPDSDADVRLRFVREVLDELETRKRRLNVFGYDDLLSRLAKSLEPLDCSARNRMQRRWRIVMVDEFQDTDPVQWQVIERAFSGTSTLVLIGDPKQAIYAFRGGDIHTYLRAARTAGLQQTLSVNWRSDKVLVERLQTVLRGAALGHPDIVVRAMDAHREGHRLRGAPHNAPFRLRVVNRNTLGYQGTDNVPIDDLRSHIPADLAADIAELLASGATYNGDPIRAGHIAVIVEQHRDARACRDALAQAGIAAVYSGDLDVFTSKAAAEWLCLLDAFEQPHRSGLVRAAACTMFFGHTADDLATEGDALTDRVATTLREWADHARLRGMAAVFEAAQLAGMGQRVLRQQGGERHMTDLAHIGQLLHELASRERLALPVLRDWLRRQRDGRAGDIERNRRLDSDAAAVQIMTVFVSKGLQFPIVYLPFAFNRNVRADDILLYHDEHDTRCLHIGGRKSPDRRAVEQLNRDEAARNDIRLTYVALTRAQSQVVAWWAPTRDEVNGGLSRLLRGRGVEDAAVPDRCDPKVSDDDAWSLFATWEAAGGPVVEHSVVGAPVTMAGDGQPADFEVRHFHRDIDTAWRRTSYSGLIRVADAPTGVSSEPEATELDDENDDIPLVTAPPGPDVLSPMADLPAGASFGTLVHAVLQDADPLAPDLAAVLREQIGAHAQWWPIGVPHEEMAAALVPMHDTPLGPLAADLTLRHIGFGDRLRELDFEFPLAGGDLRTAAPDLRLRDIGALVGRHLPADDPLAPYAHRLAGDLLGSQSLRGYLTGSIDVVLRVPGPRYLVVDYKTNWLGQAERPLTAADYGRPRLVEAMLHSDYPLQALLYSVALHRFLRWRQPGYDPQRHLGGVLYLFVRGMCGTDTPVIGGHPAGVFSWQTPPALVTALSDLLDAGRAA